jgi:hypothetical protein
MGCGSFLQTLTKSRKISYSFQCGNIRMADIGLSICWIDNYAVSQQMYTDKIRIFTYYININLHDALFGKATHHPGMRHDSFRARLLRGWLYYGFWWTAPRQKIIWTWERQKIIMIWCKGHNAKLRNLLPSLTQIICMFLCMCMNLAVKCPERYMATGLTLFLVGLIITAISIQCWDGE